MSTIVHTRLDESSLAVALQYMTAGGIQIRTKSQLVSLVLDAFANATGYPVPSTPDAVRILEKHFFSAPMNAITLPTAKRSIADQVREALKGHSNEND